MLERLLLTMKCFQDMVSSGPSHKDKGPSPSLLSLSAGHVLVCKQQHEKKTRTPPRFLVIGRRKRHSTRKDFEIFSLEDEASDEEWWRQGGIPRVEEPQGVLSQVAARFRVLSASDSPSAPEICSVSTLPRYMAAVAQGSKDCQLEMFQQTLQYIRSMQRAGSFEAILFVQQIHFDESPLKLRVAFHDDPAADLQIGKVLAVQVKWGVLVHDARQLDQPVVEADPARLRPHSDYLFLTGTLSSQVRAADKGTGEAFASVLHSCILRQHTAQTDFKTSLLVYEADSLGANDRAITLLRGEQSASVVLRMRCLCHKVHTSAQKTFSLWANMLQGVARTLLVLLQQPGVFAAFRKAMGQAVVSRCRRVEIHVRTDLPDEAEQYRQNCMRYFAPASRRGKAVLQTLSSDLFNGDWRECDVVVHRCDGCCASLAVTQAKMKTWISKLIKSLGRRLLNRGNWMHWQESLPLIGLLMSLHGLFKDAFSSAISKVNLHLRDDANVDVARIVPDPANDDADRMALWRVEQAEHRQKATEWLQDPEAWHDLYLCRVSLEGEVQLMREFVALVSRDWDVQNLSSMRSIGRREFRIKLLNALVHRFLATSTSQMIQAHLWRSLTITEADVSSCWKTLLRPMAVVFQLVQHEIDTYPLKVFLLLGGGEEEAASFLDTPLCVLDEFATHFRQLYDTSEKILGVEGQQCLSAVAMLGETNTFKTEALHSANSRKLNTRYNTHSMALPTLALEHFGVAASPWVLAMQGSAKAKDGLRVLIAVTIFVTLPTPNLRLFCHHHRADMLRQSCGLEMTCCCDASHTENHVLFLRFVGHPIIVIVYLILAQTIICESKARAKRIATTSKVIQLQYGTSERVS